MIQPDPDGAGGASGPIWEYEFDDAGQLISVTNPLEEVTTYQYDNLGRLISTSVLLPDPDGAGSLGRPETVTVYDAVGNLLSLTDPDPVGNITSWQCDNLNRKVLETNELSQTRSYAYNAMSQLAQITDRLGRVRQFAYDELGRRTQELGTGENPQYIDVATDESWRLPTQFPTSDLPVNSVSDVAFGIRRSIRQTGGKLPA